MATDATDHWERVYGDKSADRVSWYQALPRQSLDLVAATGAPRDAGIIDIGGGASALAGCLLDRGYTDLAVADISAAAMKHAQSALGPRADAIDWIVADVRDHDFARQYDIWHDRAVFHFMVEPEHRAQYLATLGQGLRPGGHVILATFGPQGPQQCSNLPVARYDESGLEAALGDEFDLRSSHLDVHETPGGAGQQFIYAWFRRRPV